VLSGDIDHKRRVGTSSSDLIQSANGPGALRRRSSTLAPMLSRWRKRRERRRLLEERRAEAARRGPRGGLFRDPIEDDPSVQPLIEKAFRLARYEMDRSAGGDWACQLTWKVMQSILEQRYDITWFSPAEMNPDTHFL